MKPMKVQQKRKTKRKSKHQKLRRYTPGLTSDKNEIIAGLLNLEFCMDRILRAFKVYEHNYGKSYDFNALIEIITRLQTKDLMKVDHEKEEEKRNSTKGLIDDIKHNQSQHHYNNYNINEINNRCSSLSLSMSPNIIPRPRGTSTSYEPQIFNHNHTYDLDANSHFPTHRPPKLIASRSDNSPLLLAQHQSEPNMGKKLKKKRNKHQRGSTEMESIKFSKKLKAKRSKSHRQKKFVSSMSLSEAKRLKLFDNIDHRDFVGKFCPATIIEIDEENPYNLKIHYDGDQNGGYDEWSNCKTELYRFAKYRSISRRYQYEYEYDKIITHKLYKANMKIGDVVMINPIYTIYGGKWYKGIINKFDKKSDQIQVAYKPKNTDDINDYILYWTHIDNTLEIKSCTNNNGLVTSPIFQAYELEQLPEQFQLESDEYQKYDKQRQRQNKKSMKRERCTKKRKPKKRNRKKVRNVDNTNFSEWNTKQVIEWIDKIENGKFKDDIYDHFKQQIKVIGLKGYELTTLNETALKFAGLLNNNDRKLIINNILNLANTKNHTQNALTLKYNQSTTTTVHDMAEDDYPQSLSVDGKCHETTTTTKYGNHEDMIDIDLNLKQWKSKQSGKSINHHKNAKDAIAYNYDDGKFEHDSTENKVLNEVMDLWKGSI